MKYAEREALYLPIVAKAFAAEGLPPELGAAIAKQESNWTPGARTLSGGDGRRGGSWGLCQMSLKTAGALARGVTVEQLQDPEYNCKLAAQLCRINWDITKGKIQDVIARYNSGKDYLLAPDSTKQFYVPPVLKFMEEYKERCAQYLVCEVEPLPRVSPEYR